MNMHSIDVPLTGLVTGLVTALVTALVTGLVTSLSCSIYNRPPSIVLIHQTI